MSEPVLQRSHGWRIGRLAGTPVYIGRSWPLILVALFAIVAPSQRDSVGLGGAVLIAGATGLMLLFSVLVHEAAHALMAAARGHRVDRIVADMWGGHTVYEAGAATPATNALVAVVGPLANLALAGAAWLSEPLVTTPLASGLLGAMTYTNLFVGLFNLLPGLPLDGGQIVSSLVWRATGRRGAGLTAAGWLGRVVAVGSVLWFIGRPLLDGEQPSTLTLVWTGLIAYFLWRGASAAVRSGQIHDATAGPASEVLEPVLLVPDTSTVADLSRLADASEPRPWVVATDRDGWPYGLIDEAALGTAATDLPATTPVSGIVLAQAPSWVVPLTPDAVLTELVRLMSERNLPVALVVDETTRRVTGLATADRVNTVVGAALERRRR